MTENTIKFTVPSDDKENMRRSLRTVFDALQQAGFASWEEQAEALKVQRETFTH